MGDRRYACSPNYRRTFPKAQSNSMRTPITPRAVSKCLSPLEKIALRPFGTITCIMHAPRLIDLFCGCGGLSLGAARAGFKLILGVDLDKRAIMAHQKNFPKSKHAHIDISTIDGDELLKLAGSSAGSVDIISGGPPCQGFSAIGKRDVQDSRNFLIEDFFRLVAAVRPKVFVMENVPGLVREKHASILKKALGLVKSQYTVLAPQKIVAYEFGAPTVRTRIIVVGFRSGVSLDEGFLEQEATRYLAAPVVRQALAGLPKDIDPTPKGNRAGERVVRLEKSGHFFDSVIDRVPSKVGCPIALEQYAKHRIVTGCLGTLHSTELMQRYGSLAAGETDPKTKSTRLDPAGYCPTLRAGTGPERGSFQAVRPIHHLRPRVITPREAARLQGFPDWFQFDETKWHSFRQLGNSVSPLVAEAVFRPIFEALNNGK